MANPFVSTKLPPHSQILKLTIGFWYSQGLYVATKLGIPDILSEERSGHAEGLTAEQIAAKIAAADKPVHVHSLYRLLRFLSTAGVFRETPPQTAGELDAAAASGLEKKIEYHKINRFSLTPSSELLRSNMRGGLRDYVLHQVSPYEFR